MSVATAQRRLAGIRFEDRTPAAPAALPRMDIAVFVGFASAGPLHTPVRIEDPLRFAELFGPDLPLARDLVSGAVRYAQLAPTVRAFFANGGQRCWVIRVTDETRAETTRVRLPGVLSASADGRLWPAATVARSPGTWADALTLRASLAPRSIALAGADLGAAVPNVDIRQSGTKTADTGDLVRLRSHRAGEEGWISFLRLGRRQPSVNGDMLEIDGAQWFRQAEARGAAVPATAVVTRFVEDDTADAGWKEQPLSGDIEHWPASADTGDRPRLGMRVAGEGAQRILAGEWLRVCLPVGGLWLAVRSALGERARDDKPAAFVEGEAWWEESSPPAWWEESSPPAVLLDQHAAWLADIVTLDLQARVSGSALLLTDLGFAPGHARRWQDLPADDELFRSLNGEPEPLGRRSPPRLWTEAAEPRFPLAGAHAAREERDGWSLPLGLDVMGMEAAARHSGLTPLEREGLDEFGAHLFIDTRLADATVDGLAGEADFIRFNLVGARHPQTLRGLHAAWPVEEASLISVPDAVHTGWERGGSPAIVAATIPDPWKRPESGMFLDCARHSPATPVLTCGTPPDEEGTFTLHWTSADGGEPRALFVLQEARQHDWSDAITIWSGPADAGPSGEGVGERTLRGRPPGDYYYRVLAAVPTDADEPPAETLAAVETWLSTVGTPGTRTEAPGSPCDFTGFVASDWSAACPVRVSVAPAWDERASHPFDARTWIAVSRSLARFCGARADALALLALPAHARENEALDLAAELLGPTGKSLGGLPLGARESVAWSYAALYHPWMTVAETGAGLRTFPPVGAMAGVYAARALARGAWIAPANEPLRGALALTPLIDPRRRQEFLERQVNLLREEPTGWLVLSQDTLAYDVDSGDSPVRPVNVRRLLILLRRLVLRVGEPFVFEPNGENLRSRVRHTFESVLATLQARGAFAGRTAAQSYQVECGDDLNPPQVADAGRLIVQIKVAPSRPMAFLTIRLVQTGDRGQVVEII